MAHKQVNALATLSGIAGDDLIPIFDSSEAGDEKLKKYTVQELKTDLTSIDPSAFGNWVQVRNVTGTTFNTVGSYPQITDVGIEKYVKMSVTIEAVDSTSIIMMSVGDNDGWDSSGSNYDGTVDGRHIISSFSASGKAVMNIIYEPKTKIFTITGTYYNGSSTSNLNVSISYKGTKTPTKIMFQSWNSVSIDITGELSIYRWQEVKPIELHSYELVKEYNLNNETLSDTIAWDGEADPDCIIMSDLYNGAVSIRPNNDSGSNYTQGYINQDGSALTGSSSTTTALYIGGSTGHRNLDEVKAYFKNTGLPRLFKRDVTRYNPSNTDNIKTLYGYWWDDTSNNVSSLTVSSNSASITGNVRFYKMVKTHLFNQTIYNNLTLNVTTTGSDTTGDGTSQKPFATVNGALSWLKNKTVNTDVDVTIQLADGTYNNWNRIVHKITPNVVIRGNPTTPANVTVNFASGQGALITYKSNYLFVSGIKFVGYDKAQWQAGLVAQWGSSLYVKDCIIDNFGAGTQSYYNAYLYFNSSTINNCIYAIHAVHNASASSTGSTISNNSYAYVAEVKGNVNYSSTNTNTNNGNLTYTTNGGTIQSY